MATTFTLKRKAFAEPSEDNKKKSNLGRKIAVGTALVGTAVGTALAARGAGGVGKLVSGLKNSGGFQKGIDVLGKNLTTGTGQTMQSVGKFVSKTAGNAANKFSQGSVMQGGLINVGKFGKATANAGKNMMV